MKIINRKIKTLLVITAISLFVAKATAQQFISWGEVAVSDSDSVNYRGKREPRESGDFAVVNIVTTRVNSSIVRFDLLFNQAIDPKSANSASYFVNGKRVSPSKHAEFSKDGKKIRIELEVKDSSFSFDAKGISSYNGKALSAVGAQLRDDGEARL